MKKSSEDMVRMKAAKKAKSANQRHKTSPFVTLKARTGSGGENSKVHFDEKNVDTSLPSQPSFATLLKESIGDVRPLAPSKIRLFDMGPEPPKKIPLKRKQADERSESLLKVGLHRTHAMFGYHRQKEIRFEVSDHGSRIEGRRVDLHRKWLEKLKQGFFHIHMKLDLHHETVDRAHEKLTSFLKQMRDAGELCVLVVHGRGLHSPSGIGALRAEMASWLSQGSASRYVAAFATARNRDGGEGACYVLLRKRS